MQNSIRVKTVEGRVARESPRGNYIPDDRFVAVKDTPYIQRLLTVHGDIVREPEEVQAEAKAAAKASKVDAK